jgi:hypothetical protein
MLSIRFRRSTVEGKQPGEPYLSAPGMICLNYNNKQPALFFGVENADDNTFSCSVVAPPVISETPPVLPAGQSYLPGQQWFSSKFSAGSDLRVWTGSEWEPVLANGLAGFTSGDTSDKPIGAKVSFLGRGTNDPPYNSSLLTALGYNSYRLGGKQAANTLSLGASMGPLITTLSGTNIFCGSRLGSQDSKQGGITSFKDCIIVGTQVGTTPKTGSFENTIILSSNWPGVGNGMDMEKITFTSKDDIFITKNEVRTTGFVDERVPTSIFYALFAYGAGNLGYVSSLAFGGNTVISNGLSFMRKGFNGEANNYTVANNVILGDVIVFDTMAQSVVINSTNSVSNNSVCIKGAVNTIDLARRYFFQPPVNDSVAIGGDIKTGVKDWTSDTRNVLIGFQTRTPGAMFVQQAGSTGLIGVGRYFFDPNAYPPLKNPVFLCNNERIGWFINYGAWSFKNPVTSQKGFDPDFGAKDFVLVSKGEEAPPSWERLPRGATGTFELDTGQTVNVEDGLITSIS